MCEEGKKKRDNRFVFVYEMGLLLLALLAVALSQHVVLVGKQVWSFVIFFFDFYFSSFPLFFFISFLASFLSEYEK